MIRMTNPDEERDRTERKGAENATDLEPSNSGRPIASRSPDVEARLTDRRRFDRVRALRRGAGTRTTLRPGAR